MDIDRSLLAMIDEYISEAMAQTGTRRAPRQTQQPLHSREPDFDVADLEPLADLIAARTQSQGASTQGQARTFVIDERNADPMLLAQVKQQLAQSESVQPLPRSRAPRSTADIIDEEITNIVPKPSKPL